MTASENTTKRRPVEIVLHLALSALLTFIEFIVHIVKARKIIWKYVTLWNAFVASTVISFVIFICIMICLDPDIKRTTVGELRVLNSLGPRGSGHYGTIDYSFGSTVTVKATGWDRCPCFRLTDLFN